MPFVRHYWFLRADFNGSRTQRIIPTGCICLMFHRGNRIYSTTTNSNQPVAFISGQSSSFHDLIQTGTADMVCVVFQPHGAGVFFRMPMNEILASTVDVCDMEDAGLIELQQRLTETADHNRCAAIIDTFLLRRLHTPKTYNHRRMEAVIKAANSGLDNITELAGVSCLGYKQFKRMFSQYAGINPKEFLRVIRFQRALYILQTNPSISLAQLACECGYYDQPHLIKEFKTFSGYTPLEYISVCAPYSDYFS